MTAVALADIAFDLILCALLLSAALAALSRQPLFGAVIFFIVYGVFAAIAWLRLGATDVALAEAAIGAGLTGVLLLGAMARLDAAAHTEPGFGLAEALTAIAAVGVTLGLGWAFLALPEPGGLQQAVAANLAQSGSENPVTAVLLNFRAWDTLLESIVLLAALIGVWALADDAAWGGRPGLRHHTRPGGVLASFGRVLPPMGLLVGVYLVWAGASQPGGAFQGGTVLAAVWLLVAMAGVVRAPHVSATWLRAALVAGPVVFLAVGLAGVAAGAFLTLPPDHAKALIVTIEVTLTLSIAITLAALVLGPPENAEQAP
ncbi:hydrogenase subunit MbhD domain-containing protein [Alkalilacustris brevis]|uniref:hydrogenase subunit MbhD domain-containing protein n=1 Tax=Alkalilacustris brevis TaxID=2026338 RepID=UPI000E0DF748|nr:hydrogenase subunit MbhD domain-containing protein [Alkalilacustris brevis]